MEDQLNATFLGNPASVWLIMGGIITAALIVLKLVKIIIIRRVKKWANGTTTTWDNFIIEIIERNLVPLLYVGAFYFPLLSLSLPKL